MYKNINFGLIFSFTLVGVFADNINYDNYIINSSPSNLEKISSNYIDNESGNVVGGNISKKILNFKENIATRGASEVNIYQKVSAGTVLISTDDGLGSGAVISTSGYIITNEHVVGRSKTVRVYFKPVGAGNDISKSLQLIGTVIKVNEEKDLALVRVDSLPSHVRPIPLKLDSPPTIGEDAHAIGHPRGEVWSYTRGYVSQYRVNYGWNTSVEDPSHKADVIQTQTPINPGNSGGPLVNSQGELIGLNSFGDPKSPGLNFAVAITSIQNFLKQEGSSRLEKKVKTSSCSKDPIGQKRESTNFGLGTTYFYDPDCKGRSTVTKIVPDKTSEPVLLYFSDPASGDKSILCLVDFDRDGVIDYTLFDADGDGIWDFEGRNKAGEVTASDMKPIKKG